MEHPDPDVQRAIVNLSDALCSWERSTFRQSVLIIKEEGGFQYRADSGKPGIPEDVTNDQLLGMIE